MLARVPAPREAPGVVVLDVGGATTDVYCVPDPDAEQATLGREAVGVPARRRTVEGDLGVSWSVDALRAAAAAEGLPVPGRRPAGARRGGGHDRAAPAPARRGGATGRAGPAPGRPGWSCSPAGCSGTPSPAAVDAVVGPDGRGPRGSRRRAGRHRRRRRPALRARRGRPAGRRTTRPPRRDWSGGCSPARSRPRPGDDRELRAERVGDRRQPAVEEVLRAAGAAAGLERTRTASSVPATSNVVVQADVAPGAPMTPATSWPSGRRRKVKSTSRQVRGCGRA